jgi:hypothetical protein
MLLRLIAVISAFLSAFSMSIALFFLRFFRDTRDRFFAFFSAAFGLLALDWLLRAVLAPENDSGSSLFFLRLIAFLLIIVAIADKNRPRQGGDRSPSSKEPEQPPGP